MKKTTAKFIVVLASVILIAIIVWVIAFYSYWLPSNVYLIKDSGSGISDYSAVFLTNGQVYFGKMYRHGGDEVDLRDIFYLQVNQQIQPASGNTSPSSSSSSPSSGSTSSNSNNVVLVKLGSELHGPNDRMLIYKDQVLFTESLKDSSKVVNAINNYKS